MTRLWIAMDRAGQLVPADEKTARWLAKRQPGEVFEFVARQERNYRLLKKAHTLVNLVYENDRKFGWRSREECRESLTIAAGHVEPIILVGGGKAERAKSWSFDRCDEDAFRDFYKRLVDIVFEYIYPDATMEMQIMLDGFND